jgi:hypothetical protein
MINKKAPVFATGEIEVAASPEVVWEILANIERWPTWNLDVKVASLNGELAKGTMFRWKAGPGTITSTLQSVEPLHLLAWTGNTFGIGAIHVWRMEPHDGNTIVRTEESWDGLIVSLFQGSMQKSLEKAIHDGLHYLKIEVERRAKG